MPGVSVVSLAAVGGGVCDLLVGVYGVNLLLEVKTAEGTLTPDQVAFFRDWKGQKAIVRSANEAIDYVTGVMRDVTRGLTAVRG